MLLGHSISAELDSMEKIGIDLRDQRLFSIEGILDTGTISKHLGLPFSQRPSLAKLLGFFAIPFQTYSLHNSGNDAHFTLRALLMLATTAFESMQLDKTLKTRVEHLKLIALDPIHLDARTPDEERKVLREEAKKAAGQISKQKSMIQISSDLLDGSEDASLEMIIFGMGADT